MDSPSSVLSSPSKALHPLSPERINQQTIQTSPCTASDVLRMHRKGNRGLSDVQAKVAYLNNLSRGSSPAGGSQSSAAGAAALQRAILGREEAESALVRVSSQLSESQSRERRISERLESLLEDLQTAKERQAHERLVFEKEIRKARKEAFRAGSTLVKAQEELKHVRTEAKILKDEVCSEREAKEEAKQESFERAYAIAGLTEELEMLKARVRTAEAKSHSATLEARGRKIEKEPMPRMSLAEGDLALIMTPAPRRPKRSAEDSNNSPLPITEDHSVAQDTPPKRLRLSDVAFKEEDLKAGSAHDQKDLIEELGDALKLETRLRVDAEDMIQFLQVECQFKRCSCRILEDLEKKDQSKESIGAPESGSYEMEAHLHDHDVSSPNQTASPQQPDDEQLEVAAKEVEVEMEEPLITFSPVTGTFRTIPSPARISPHKQPRESDAAQNPQSQLVAEQTFSNHSPKYESHLHARSSESILQNEAYSRDATPGSHYSPIIAEDPRVIQVPTEHHAESPNDIINMKRIPLRPEDRISNRFAHVPGTPVSREEALAQIRARRGKTSTLKRSVSDNEAAFRAGGIGVTPVRTIQRIPGVQNTDPRAGSSMRNRRDLSAPVRMLR